MPNPDPQRQAELRALIHDFLKKRLDDKLDKLDPDDPKRTELHQRFDFATWIKDATSSCAKIHTATHTIKPIHPYAQGTNVFSALVGVRTLNEIGSHSLAIPIAIDIVCDAKLLPVATFLKLQHRGRTLLDLALAEDVDLRCVLNDDIEIASTWMQAFASTTKHGGEPASHTLGKQLYWPTGNDPHDDASFHLLAPLYASSLAHRVFLTINSQRFGDTVKATRQARKDGVFSDQVLHDYPQMAIQKLGGTKPQNISQLNSERRGDNCLLASLPPVWKSADVTPLLGSESLFRRFERRTEVRRLVKALLAFLKTDPARNIATREHRDELVNAVIDELLQFAAELRTLPPGWSQQENCDLKPAEKHWLDPDGVAAAAQAAGQPLPTDSAERVSAAFANWLNAQLRDPLPMGDPEFLHWRDLLLEQIEADAWEGSHDD